MKKLIAVLLTLSMIFAFAACSMSGSDETSSADETTVSGEGDSTASAEGEDVSASDTGSVVADERAGAFELLEENNDASKIKKNFDEDYTEDNTALVIGTDGSFRFNINNYDADGTVEADGDDLVATYTVAGEEGTKTCTLKWKDSDSSYTMEAEGVKLVWTMIDNSNYAVFEPVSENIDQFNKSIGSKLGYPSDMTVSDEKVKADGEGTEFAIVYMFTSDGMNYEFRATKEETEDLILGSLSSGSEDFTVSSTTAYKSTDTQKCAYWKVGELNYCLIITDNGAMTEDAFSAAAENFKALTK